MDINTDNITALLKEQIAKFEGTVERSLFAGKEYKISVRA